MPLHPATLTHDSDQPLRRARALAQMGNDAAAQLAYIEILRGNLTHFHALNELGNLALG